MKSNHENIFRECDDLLEICQAVASAKPSGIRSILRWIQILKYYRWSQLILRATRPLRNRLKPFYDPALTECPSVTLCMDSMPLLRNVANIAFNHWHHEKNSLKVDLVKGRLKIHDQTCDLGVPIQWQPVSQRSPTALWRFQFQYHEFLLGWIMTKPGSDCSTATPQVNAHRVAQVVSELAAWNLAFPSPSNADDPAAWHPYCISRRLPVWLWLVTLMNQPDDAQDLLQSIRRQAHFLSKRLEHDPGGNHLLENLTSLAVTGAVLACPEAESWLERGRIPVRPRTRSTTA